MSTSESLLHQFNDLPNCALMHPATAAEQADGIKLCWGACHTQSFWASFLFGGAAAAAELDLPSRAFVHPATSAESLHCTE